MNRNGYYDVCYIAGEVQEPSKNVPMAVTRSAFLISVVYFLVYIAVMGYMPWSGPDGFINQDSAAYHHIMSIFFERMYGDAAGFIFTLVVVFTIFGSAFAMMVGYISIPRAAALDGYFLDFFAHEHPEKKGLADHSLFIFSLTTAVFCFVKLELVIEGMLTMRLMVQFAAQAMAVMRMERGDEDRSWAQVCAKLCLPVWILLFVSTQNYTVSGQAPLLEFSVVFLGAGVGAFLAWATAKSYWPCEGRYGGVQSDLITMPLTDEDVSS